MRHLAFEDFVLSSHNLHIESSFLLIGDIVYETWKAKNESKNVLSALFGTCLSCSVSFQVTTYTHTHTPDTHTYSHTHTTALLHVCIQSFSFPLLNHIRWETKPRKSFLAGSISSTSGQNSHLANNFCNVDWKANVVCFLTALYLVE